MDFSALSTATKVLLAVSLVCSAGILAVTVPVLFSALSRRIAEWKGKRAVRVYRFRYILGHSTSVGRFGNCVYEFDTNGERERFVRGRDFSEAAAEFFGKCQFPVTVLVAEEV